MFHNSGALKPTLKPEDYSGASFYAEEARHLFNDGWHLAGLLDELDSPGDYLSIELFGRPVLLRNIDGEIHAYENICAHRHTLIVAPGRGRAETIRCQYHGWEYRSDGRLGKLPDGRSFSGLRADNICIRKYRVETLGPLILVNTSATAESFRESAGKLWPELNRYYGNHRVVWRWSTEHAVNWKVIAENAVESYHVPIVHPNTFKDFREPHLHDHSIEATYTRYLDLKPWGDDLEGLLVRTLCRLMIPQPNFNRFTQANLFPNFLFYYNELFSNFIYLEPLGPQSTRQVLVALVPREIRWPLICRPLQWLFERVFIRQGRKVLLEDMSLWQSIQAGLNNSRFDGVLSCREERVFALQEYVAKRVGGGTSAAPVPLAKSGSLG